LDWSEKFFKKILMEMFRFALPLIPAGFVLTFLTNSTPFFIKFFCGTESVGLYAIGSVIAAGVTIFVSAFQSAWNPFAYSILTENNATKIYANVLTAYTIFMSFVALNVSMFSKELLLVFTSKNYYNTYLVAGILSINAVIYGYSSIAAIGSGIAKNNKPLATSILFALIITVISYCILIPIWGKEGAAVAAGFGYLIVPIYLFYKGQKHLFIPYNFYIPIIFLFKIALLFYVSLKLTSNLRLGYGIMIKLMLEIVYFGSTYLILKFFYKDFYKSFSTIFSYKKKGDFGI